MGTQEKTIITREYPRSPYRGDDVYYPMNTQKNSMLVNQYKKMAALSDVIFAGRLGTWEYMDMCKVIEDTLKICKGEFYEW
jgi:UDP-galactopyranose mutase